MTWALAEQEPWSQPDSGHGYHVMTFGFLVGEIVRRVSGERLGAFFEREVAAPLEADVRFGTAAGDDARTADYYLSSQETPVGVGADVPLLQARAYLNPPGIGGRGTVNTRAWRAAEMPSTSMHATARGIARI
jgi:CubicO group peptidase (beta-lactamase class C family)